MTPTKKPELSRKSQLSFQSWKKQENYDAVKLKYSDTKQTVLPSNKRSMTAEDPTFVRA